MKKDNLEVTIIILSTCILLLIIMITILVVDIERKMTYKPIPQPTEDKIPLNSNNLTNGFYYNTSDDTNLTNIMFNSDGSFVFNYNTCEGDDHLSGTYSIDGNYIYMSFLDDTPIEKEFMMVMIGENMLEYRGSSIGCSPYENSVYMLK